MLRVKHKLEFSKIIMICAIILNIIVIMFSIYMMYVTQNLDPLAYLIPSTGAEVATISGFYSNKAKLENKIKLMNTYKITEEEINEYESND